jgi:DNA-binding Lrp family transcriptional regulator
MDSYVYLRQVSPESLQKLVEMLGEDKGLTDEDRAGGAIRALGVLTGEYDAVVFVEAGDLEGIERVVLERIRGDAGVAMTETYLALEVPPEISGGAAPPPSGGLHKVVPDAPKRRMPAMAFEATINVKAEPGQAEWVFWDLFHNLPGNPVGPGLQGEALTTGPWDILVELGADTYQDLSNFILRVKRWTHVVNTAPAGVTLLGGS